MDSIINIDTITVDPTLTVEQNELLNMEVSPEIEAILINHVYKVAMKEYKEFTSYRAQSIGVDEDRLLSTVIDIQDQMANVMKQIQGTESARQVALADLDQWVNRFNTWKDSPKYNEVTYQVRTRAWDVYKKELNSKKGTYHFAKNQVSSLWEVWKNLKNECQAIVGERSWLWGKYFNLINELINTYQTNGDTTEVDEQVSLYPTINQMVDFVRDSHIEEMEQYDRPEAKGRGYWSYSNEMKVNNSDDYIKSLFASEMA